MPMEATTNKRGHSENDLLWKLGAVALAIFSFTMMVYCAPMLPNAYEAKQTSSTEHKTEASAYGLGEYNGVSAFVLSFYDHENTVTSNSNSYRK